LSTVAVSASQSTVCASKPTTLTASGGTAFAWAPAGGSQSAAVVMPASTTVYTVTATDAFCSNTNTVEIYTNPNPVITITETSSLICEGESVTITLSGADTYTWTGPVLTGTNVTVSPMIPTAYNVAGTNSFGCSSSAQQIVIVQPSP